MPPGFGKLFGAAENERLVRAHRREHQAGAIELRVYREHDLFLHAAVSNRGPPNVLVRKVCAEHVLRRVDTLPEPVHGELGQQFGGRGPVRGNLLARSHPAFRHSVDDGSADETNRPVQGFLLVSTCALLGEVMQKHLSLGDLRGRGLVATRRVHLVKVDAG